jgi:hypothetical protein
MATGKQQFKDPATARKWAEWAAEEPPPAAMVRAAEQGHANWPKNVKIPKGGWVEWVDVQEALKLDPNLGAKTAKMADSGDWSARATEFAEGQGGNYARKVGLGGTVDPISAKVVWDDTGKQLAISELDGLRRMVAVRNMFGRNQKVPIVFSPSDDVARSMSMDETFRKGVRPLEATQRADDMKHKFADTWKTLEDMDY